MLRHGRYSCEQPVQLHLGPSSLPRRFRTHRCINNISSLKKSRLAATLVSCRPMMSQPISWCTSSTSAALPTPCFSFTVIISTLWVAMASSLLRARSRSLLACHRAARRPALSLRLFFLPSIFSFSNFLDLILCPTIPAPVRA